MIRRVDRDPRGARRRPLRKQGAVGVEAPHVVPADDMDHVGAVDRDLERRDGRRRHDRPGGEPATRRGELLDPFVEGVGDVDVPERVDGDAFGVVELSVPRAEASPPTEVVAEGVEPRHAVVPLVDHVQVAVRRHRDRGRIGHLTVARARSRDHVHEVAVGIVFRDLVDRYRVEDSELGHVDVPARIDRDALGSVVSRVADHARERHRLAGARHRDERRREERGTDRGNERGRAPARRGSTHLDVHLSTRGRRRPARRGGPVSSASYVSARNAGTLNVMGCDPRPPVAPAG